MIGAPAALIAQIAFLSLISFGGVPGVLPALHDYVVQTNGWLSDRDFANCFAVVQAIPGPNMILMMSFIGWQVGGLPTAVASAVATFAPPCALSFTAYRFWDRFRDTAWQQRARRGLAPVTIGLVLAGGLVMAQVGDTGWGTVSVTVAAAVLPLLTRVNPLWLLAAGAALGGLGEL
jgi:chromate transporter